MVSPVTNGMPQQIPAANTFQPGGSADAVRQKEDREETRASSASTTNETRTTESRQEERSSSVTASARDDDNGQTRSRSDRGSVIDVVV